MARPPLPPIEVSVLRTLMLWLAFVDLCGLAEVMALLVRLP